MRYEIVLKMTNIASNFCRDLLKNERKRDFYRVDAMYISTERQK